MLSYRYFLLLVSLIFTVSLVSEAGVLMKQERYQKGSSSRQQGSIMIQENKLRFNDLDSDFSSIIDLVDNKIYFIDHNSRVYTKSTLDEYVSTVKEKASIMEEEMKMHFSALPPDQQDTIKELMKRNSIPSGKQGKSRLDVKKTQSVDEIAGAKAVKYEVYIDGELNEEIWISDKQEIRSELNYQRISEMIKDFKVLSNHFYSDELLNNQQYSELFQKGFPLKTINHSFENSVYVEEITDIKAEEFSVEKFRPEPGYKRGSLDTIFQ